MSAAVSASRFAVSTFSVTTSQVIIGPMNLPCWSDIALTLSSNSSGPTLIVAVRGRLRGSASSRRWYSGALWNTSIEWPIIWFTLIGRCASSFLSVCSAAGSCIGSSGRGRRTSG